MDRSFGTNANPSGGEEVGIDTSIVEEVPCLAEIDDNELQRMVTAFVEDEDVCSAEKDILPYMDRLHTSQLLSTPTLMERDHETAHASGEEYIYTVCVYSYVCHRVILYKYYV